MEKLDKECEEVKEQQKVLDITCPVLRIPYEDP